VADRQSQLNVAHLDADAFYVSVELLRHPELRGRPVVVAHSSPRAVVTTASYEARRYGVGSAMPATRARRLCPDAVFLPPDFSAYRDASKRLMAIVREHIECVDVVGLDEAYLDVSTLHSPRAAMRRLLARIREQTRLTCSVGIGPNRLVAKVASDAEKPGGFVVLTREQACARFARAGVRALRAGGARARPGDRPQDRRATARARAADARVRGRRARVHARAAVRAEPRARSASAGAV
jgi:DNA polymerase-4